MRAAPAPAPRPTQAMALDRGRTAAEARTLDGIARTATAGAVRPFPHSTRIATAFGRYAPQGLRALVGGAAAVAGDALHADAFVRGNRAGFVRMPSLRLAAHEAAHAVAQAHGVAPAGGVGAPGDSGERFADAVADRVASGGSAESLFADTLAGQDHGAPRPALQMANRITHYTAPVMDTPWKEIADQLGVSDPVMKLRMAGLGNAFETMVDQLGNSCPRATQVIAKIDGGMVPPRKSDPLQTAFGTLGTFMEVVTGSQRPGDPHYAFEGGHLIADEILGSASYRRYNFAPQRKRLNSPAYRNIEKLARGTIVRKDLTVTEAEPERTMTVTLGYVPAPLSLPTGAVVARLGLQPGEMTKTPAPPNVTVSHRVPLRWDARIDSGSANYIFDKTSSIDTAATTGARVGFENSEADVRSRSADAITYGDTLAWSMDSMHHGVDGLPDLRTTGSDTDRKASHSFTGVQSVPMGQTAMQNKGLAPLAPPVAPTPLALTWAPSFRKLEAAGVTGGPLDNARRDKFIRRFKRKNAHISIDDHLVHRVIASFEYSMLLHHNSGERVSFHSVLKRLKGTDRERRETIRLARALGSHMRSTKRHRRPFRRPK